MIVLLSRDQFNAAAAAANHAGLDVVERISLFVRLALETLSERLFLASVEIKFWYRIAVLRR